MSDSEKPPADQFHVTVTINGVDQTILDSQYARDVAVVAVRSLVYPPSVSLPVINEHHALVLLICHALADYYDTTFPDVLHQVVLDSGARRDTEHTSV